VVPTTGLNEIAADMELGSHELVSIVGGGGKSTLLFLLAQQLSGRRLVTTTTKMGAAQTGGLAALIDPSDDQVRSGLDEVDCLAVWQSRTSNKLLGIRPERCDQLFAIADHVVVEADGAAGRPFKAPRSLEPVIPGSTTVLVASMGADALGRVIADRCHRPLRVAAVAGCSPYERLTPSAAAKVLLDPRGSRKGCPPDARFVVVVNRVSAESAHLVEDLAAAVEGRAEVVLVGFDPDAVGIDLGN
jgi:probable selenium-dependent hydroxylase accessory protein YqeC